jgi:hypothetical protein
MNKLWLIFGVFLAPISLGTVVLQVFTSGLGLATLLTVGACFLPLVAFYGLAMNKSYFNKIVWRIVMWLIALGLLKAFIMPFFYMTFENPPIMADDRDGLYVLYVLSAVATILSIFILFGMYKYSEFVGNKNA